MIRNLREKLNTLSTSPKKPLRIAETVCWVRDTEAPLANFDAVNAWHARILGINGFNPRRALFLDTETTGLGGAGTVAFLIGAGFAQGDRFVVRQFLMRDYGQEASQLQLFAELASDFDSLVTFNGKSFDVPLLRSRFTLQRMDKLWRDLPQLDLLHAARRVWKLRLTNCSLQRLEAETLGLIRTDDLAGAEVPQRFFDYLKSEDFSLLEDVLRHNAQDILSLAALLCKLTEAYEHAEEQQNMLDVFSLGRSFLRVGEQERARRCFRIASMGPARRALAESYRSTGEWEQAQSIYEEMVRRGECGVEPYIRLAILAEHRFHDPQKALTYTRQAMLRAPTSELQTLERRRMRLAAKIERNLLR